MAQKSKGDRNNEGRDAQPKSTAGSKQNTSNRNREDDQKEKETSGKNKTGRSSQSGGRKS